MLADPAIEAVYVATPHPMHAEWALRAAEAGKHILCEKPLGLNLNEAQFIVDAAARNDVFLMEAFMYRCSPQTARLCELIREGTIGEVRVIRATFSFHAGYDLERRTLNNGLGGGGILDVGCYTTSMARLIAGVACGEPFAEPIEVKGTGHVGAESRCDEWAIASLKFPGGIVAQCATGVQLAQESDVVIYGSEGSIVVPSPWFCAGREGGTSRIVVRRSGAEEREVTVESAPLYAVEADVVGRNIEKRQGAWPAMSWDDTLGNMRTLDRWREDVGVVYDGEQPAAYAQPIGRPQLRVRSGNNMPYGELTGLDKRVSKLVMGTMAYSRFQDAAFVFDEFYARGGNCYDTAFVYGGGDPERSLGEWMKTRHTREETVVVVKGAHTPHCFPVPMKEELTISLDRLQTGYADIYMLHRDNLDVPVGEWVDALNDEVAAGRVRAFGGSNWAWERIEAANRYAAEHGKQGFSVVSNNFSLARMVSPVWNGCQASSEPAFREWHARTQFPLFAWSSQARGFFAPGRVAPDRTVEPELMRCWYSDDNFERLRRVNELADGKGVSPMAIVLRYVLAQLFPVFALIGPENLAELRSSFEGLALELTDAECAWLDLGATDRSA